VSQETKGQTEPAERIAALEQRVAELEQQLAAQTRHQELIGKTVNDLWPPEHAQVYRAMDQALMARPQQQVYQARVRDGSGRDRDAVFAKNVFYHENGNVAGIAGAYLDITERKRATEELRGNVARLTALIENLQMGVLMESEDRRILHTNQALCDLLGAPNPQMLIGLDCEIATATVKTLFADPQGFIDGITARLAAREIAVGEQLALADGRVFERDYVPIRAGDEPAGTCGSTAI